MASRGMARRRALTALVTLLAAASTNSAAGASEGENKAHVKYMRKHWSDVKNFAVNDRVLLTTRGVGEDMGSDKIRVVCLAKGAKDTVQEPATFVDIHSSLIRISTRASCVFSGSDGFIGRPSWSTNKPPAGTQASPTTDKNATKDGGYNKTLQTQQTGRRKLLSTGTCGTPPPTCCAVSAERSKDARADGLPRCKNPSPLPRTDGWYGEYHADIYTQFAFKVAMVNGKGLSEITKAGIKANWNIEPAHGINAKVVTPPNFTSSDSGGNPYGIIYDAKFASNGHSPWAMYDGGVMVTAKIGPELTYRMFMFKNDALIADAKKDPKNAGLPYAHPFPSANGCNAEVVYEFKPKAGGGLEVNLGLEQLMMRVMKTVSWLGTDKEVVITAARAAIKKAARYPVPLDQECDAEGVTEELVRFSRSFICASTGQRVVASVFGPKDSALKFHPEKPVKFEDMFPNLMSKTDAPGFDFGGLDFRLGLNESQAPASCGTMYWDPYLQSPLAGPTATEPNPPYDTGLDDSSLPSDTSAAADSRRASSALSVVTVAVVAAAGIAAVLL